jgi:hypothetical protein
VSETAAASDSRTVAASAGRLNGRALRDRREFSMWRFLCAVILGVFESLWVSRERLK